MKKRLVAYCQLMRADKPVGTVLLTCPMLWALWIAGQGQPPAGIVFIFLIGAFLMRSAGCVVNDIADRKFDHQVQRTRDRPLTSGRITTYEALGLFVLLLSLSMSLLLWLPVAVLKPALLAFVLACFYPFTKRFFSIPQIILGFAFSSAILMAYAAITNSMPASAWLLFAGASLWPVIYDNYYAMVDKNDDIHLGIRSSALWFGQYSLMITALLSCLFIVLLLMVGVINNLGLYYYLGLVLSAACFIYQYKLGQKACREAYFQAFLNNQWVGVLIFLGIVLDYLPQT